MRIKYLLVKAYYTRGNEDLEYLEIGEIYTDAEDIINRLRNVTKKLVGNTPIGNLQHIAYRINILSWVEANMIASFIFEDKHTKCFGSTPCLLIDKIKETYKQIYKEDL